MKRRIALVLAAALALAGAGLARPGLRAQPPTDAPTPSGSIAPEIYQRLAELTPDNPEAYFLLAEEVADSIDTPEEENLAKTLYALAFELDRQPGHAGTLAASAALGLASVERLDRDRRWLVALAASIDRRYALPDWSVATGGAVTDEQAYNAASVLGLARAGEGREAKRWMERPGVADTLRRYERLIGDTGETGALTRLTKYIETWPCPQCRNERVVAVPGERGPERRLCPSCRGNPGPMLSMDELIAHLRFEAALLDGIHRSWAAQTIVDQSAPLRDPDPAELAATYRVDAARPYWRGGQWVSEAEAR